MDPPVWTTNAIRLCWRIIYHGGRRGRGGSILNATGSFLRVLRVLRGMGFDGYDEFRRYLHELALVQATQLDTMQPGFARESKVSAHLQESLARDADNVAALGRTLDFTRIEALAGRLYAARRI